MRSENGEEMILPNFLVVGAARSGTTALLWFLAQHPQIYTFPNKGSKFLSGQRMDWKGPVGRVQSGRKIEGLEEYAEFFQGREGEKMVGEASVDYLYFYEETIKNIKKYLLEEPKIIIILRDPVERAVSGYEYFWTREMEDLRFEEALEREGERERKGWHWMWQYKKTGLYYEQVKAYLDSFAEVKVLFYEDFKKNNETVLREVYEFLGVDEGFRGSEAGSRINASGRETWLYKAYDFLRKSLRFLDGVVPKGPRRALWNLMQRVGRRRSRVSEKVKQDLRSYYEKDIAKLEKLLGRDLSGWRS